MQKPAENRNPPSAVGPDFDSDLKAAIARRRTKMDRQQSDSNVLKVAEEKKSVSHVVFSTEIGNKNLPIHVSNSDSKLIRKSGTGNSPPQQRIGLSLKESVQNNINGHHQQAAAAQMLQQNYNNHLVSTSTNGSGMNSKKDSG